MVLALAGCGGGGGGGVTGGPPTTPAPSAQPLARFPAVVVLQLDRSSPPVGSVSTVQLTATAYDADLVQIKFEPYSTPIVVASDETTGQVTLSKTTLANPQDTIQVRYGGKLLQRPVTLSVTSPPQRNSAGNVLLTPDPWTRYGPTTYLAINATTVGPDGNIWFSECGVLAGATCKLGKLVPGTGSITEFADVQYANGLVAGPDGNVWFTEGNHNAIGRITPTGSITEFPIPSGAPGNGSTAGPIVVGPDGNVWFAEGDRIGVVSTTSGAITEYPIGGLFRPRSLVVGPDSALWFSEVSQIGRITTGGAVTQYPVDSSGFHSPGALVFGPGTTMYFSASGIGAGPIWSMSTSGVVSQTSLAPGGANFLPVLGIAPGGLMWGQGSIFDQTAYAQGGGMASLSFTGGWTLYLAGAPAPFGSTVGVSHGVFGPDGNLWFANGQGLARFRLAL